MLKFSQISLLVVLLASTGLAQNRMGAFRSGRSRGGHTIIRQRHRPFNRAYGYYGLPYFDSDYYEPYDSQYQPTPPEASAPESQPPMPPQAEPLPDPVLLELHGTKWVRVTNSGGSSDQAVVREVAAPQQAQAKPLPPAVLVYRDGHSEEVSSYSIIGDAIYIKTNHWTTGSWTRTIQVADLNIPATLSENQKRGVDFELPSSPNEVMIRP